MTSATQQGKERVKEVIDKYYKPNGWRCWKPGNKVQWIRDKKTGRWIPISQSQDILECYDFVATKKDKPLHAVQVTSISTRPGKKETKGITSLVAERRNKIDELGIMDGNTWSIVIAREPRKEPRMWIVCQPRGGEWTEIPMDAFIRNFLV